MRCYTVFCWYCRYWAGSTSSASNLTVRWFFLFNLPNLTGPDPDLANLTKHLHEWGAWCLLALVCTHTSAAFWHEFVLKDGVLRRMLPLPFSGVTMKLHRLAVRSHALMERSANAGCWKPVTSPKSLSFVASQAGAPFPGEFKSYSAQLCLDDKDAPGTAHGARGPQFRGHRSR